MKKKIEPPVPVPVETKLFSIEFSRLEDQIVAKWIQDEKADPVTLLNICKQIEEIRFKLIENALYALNEKAYALGYKKGQDDLLFDDLTERNRFTKSDN